MDKTGQLEILARALLGGLVELHGREQAAHVLIKLAEGLLARFPVDGGCRCGRCGHDDGSNGTVGSSATDLQEPESPTGHIPYRCTGRPSRI
jgi:hypothetical protein